MDNNIQNNENDIDINAPLTFKNLVDYTEQILLLAVNTVIKEAIKEVREEMATKEELKKMRTEMATKEDIKGLREEMVTKEYVDKLIIKEDQITGLLKNNEAELAASRGARLRQQDEIDDHEIRIKTLERAPA
ncbi:MAG: hypothetical protein WCW25_02730 [Patescibacteria group bacterium]|jgi:hypothetical protein